MPTAGEEEDFLFPSLVDIDNDGDLDLFLPITTEENFELRYYRNNLLSSTEDIVLAQDIVIYPIPTGDIVQITKNTENQSDP